MKRYAILNKDNVAVAIFSVSDTDPILGALIAGLMSNPIIAEVDLTSEASLGWKYINGEAVKNAN